MNRLELFERCATRYTKEGQKVFYPVIQAIYDETMDLSFFKNLTKEEASLLGTKLTYASTLHEVCELINSSKALLGYEFVIKIFDVAYLMSGENALFYTVNAISHCLKDYQQSL